MVGRLLRFILLAAIVGGVPHSQAEGLADYHLGDTVSSDVAAPVRLTVPDPEATAALKEKAAAKVHVICRYYPKAADQAGRALRQAFAQARSNFLDRVEEIFAQRRLDEPTVASEAFRKLVAGYESRNWFAPLDFKLAATWARGESDAQIQNRLADHLRTAMSRAIRPDRLPDGIKLTYTLRLAVMTNSDSAPTLATVQNQGAVIIRTNVISLSRQRLQLLRGFDPDERAWAEFTAGFLRVNLVPDAQLTQQARDLETEALQVADTYEAGQLIVRRGEVVNRKILAALSQLKQLQPGQPAAAQSRPIPAAARSPAAVNDPQLRWIFGALVGIFLMLLVILWLVARRHQPATLLPAQTAGGLLELPPGSAWQPPALDAEAAARSSRARHFARWLSDKMTRRLVQQRAELLNAHQSAALEISELNARLEKVHAPLQDRLRAYEQRIAELEKELTLKSEENRELIKFKIQLVRKHLEAGRDCHRLIVNPGTAGAREIRLKPGANILGRSSAADFQIDDPTVSGRHCEITISEAGVMIRDLDSTNGTRINGSPVQAAVLQSGQRVRVGSVEMFFTAEPPVESLAAAETGQSRTAPN